MQAAAEVPRGPTVVQVLAQHVVVVLLAVGTLGVDDFGHVLNVCVTIVRLGAVRFHLWVFTAIRDCFTLTFNDNRGSCYLSVPSSLSPRCAACRQARESLMGKDGGDLALKLILCTASLLSIASLFLLVMVRAGMKDKSSVPARLLDTGVCARPQPASRLRAAIELPCSPLLSLLRRLHPPHHSRTLYLLTHIPFQRSQLAFVLVARSRSA